MIVFFALVVAVVALILARKAFNQITGLRARLDALEAVALREVAATPSLTPRHELEQTLATSPPGTPAGQPEMAGEPTTAIGGTDSRASNETAAAPPSAAPALPGLEERVGTRWVVWLGGATLALGGFFLVRYSIDAGLLGPGVRVVLGGLFALALLAAGESTRRRENASTIQILPIANIPAILTAAGTAVAFATVYAAYALYDFLAPATAFLLLGLVALGTLAAALLHGPVLAGLGIVGAFATPVLVSSERPDFWSLYIYLAIVTAAAFGLARIRLWRWLAVSTIAFALLWTLPFLKFDPPVVGPYAFHVLSGFALAALLVVCGFMFGPASDEGHIEPISSGSLAAYLLGATVLVLVSSHADAALIVFAILVAAALFVAWFARAATGAIAFAAAFVFVVFAEWAVHANPDLTLMPGGPLPGMGGPAAIEGSVSLHLITAAIFAAGFGLAGFAAQGRSVSAIVPVVWSAAGVFTPLALLIALYDCARADVDGNCLDLDAAADSFPAIACGNSGWRGGAARRLGAADRRRRDRHDADLQLAVVGLRRPGGLVLDRRLLPAPPRRRRPVARGGGGGDPVHGIAGVHRDSPRGQRWGHLPRQHFAHGIRAPGLLAIGLERLRVRSHSLIHNIGPMLLTIYAGLVTVFGLWLLETPILWPTDVGGGFINLLLLAYALPALLALLLSYAVAGRRPVAYANTIAAFALMLALTYVTFEIRRLYHGPVLTRGATTGAEQYTYSIAWLAFGVTLLGIGIAVDSLRARLASAAVIALMILKAFMIDMSTLTGVYRALSFICLGLVLVAIGWFYQRVLSRRPKPQASPATQAGT